MNHGQLLTTARERLGIEALNAMQRQVWQCGAQRIAVLSPTGSGKTIAFVGALLMRLGAAGQGMQALVLAPSRELVIQISEVARALAVGYKVAAFYGKHSMTDEINSLRGAPDIIIATPGRLLDHLQRATLSVDSARLLAIDEYDKALEMGFHGEMSRICRRLKRLKFIIVTSATKLAELPDFIDLTGLKTIDNTAESSTVAARLDIARVESPARDKLDTLVELLLSINGERAIVFVNHRESAERVFDRLKRCGFAAGLYHGGLEQDDRERAIIRLNNGSTPVLVATDLGSRGLDIDSVSAVIHYHMPPSAEAWTHRNGRTARVDATGRVYIITCEGENIADYISWEHDFHPTADADSKPSRPDIATLYINAGRREKISRGDIMGFMVKTAGLESDQIGKIDVRDHSAYVAVSRSALSLIAALNSPKIKSTRVRISPLK